MKVWNKLVALVLVLVLALSLTACGGFSGRMAKAAIKMQKVQNLRMDIDVDLGMSMSVFGEAMDLSTAITGPVDIINAPMKLKADLNMTVMDEPIDLLCYADQAGNSTIVYFSADDGENWSKTTTETGDLSANASMNADTIKALAALASSFEEKGTETVKGSEAIVYSAVLDMTQLEGILSLQNTLDAIEKVSDLKLDELDLSTVAPVPVTLCIDKKTNMLVKYTADVTSLMQAMTPLILQAALDSALSESGLGDLADLGNMDLSSFFQFDVSKVVVSAVLYDFDAVGEITIPPEALAAEELSV